jgi:hypothetical protein
MNFMASLEEFRRLLHDGNMQQALTEYELDFNEAEFDIVGAGEVKGYETEIVWKFEGPNKIKMFKKTGGDGADGKKIYYLPWASKGVTKVTLDSSSPGHFVTSHFSNCRFTMSFEDDQAKKVTVQHAAGDTGGGSGAKGMEQRDKLEEPVLGAVRTRRFSISGDKQIGKAGKKLMEERIAMGTTYYDSYARVFGTRSKTGSWVFYMQNINREGRVLGYIDTK